MAEKTDGAQVLHLGKQNSPAPGQIIGYARVSSADQNLDRQLAALEEAGVQKIWHEKVSGATRDRPELARVMEYVREGDTLVVASMDRLARSVPDLYAIVEELNDKGVVVRFLKEGQLYDAHSDATSQLMLGVLGVVAQFERALIRERQAEGIARAKERGVYDRAPAMSKDEIQQARDLIALGVPKAEVARRLDVSRSTLYKYVVTPDRKDGKSRQ